jgi:hypothetical protein
MLIKFGIIVWLLESMEVIPPKIYSLAWVPGNFVLSRAGKKQ